MIRLERRTVGRGADSLLLLHGWSFSSEIWGYEGARLGSRARAVLPDLPGHGHTPLVTGGRPLRVATVEGLADLWSEERLGGAPAVGWALGAQLLINAMAAGAIDPSRLFLVALPPPATEVPDPLRGPLWRDWPRYSRLITRMMFARPPSPETAHWLGVMSARTSLAAAGLYLAEPWTPPALPFRLPPGSLIVHGRLDRIAAVDPVVDLGRQWACDVEVWDGVGHCPFLEVPSRFARTFDDWWRG